MLSDLRESGAIEQDADIIIFPYRPMYYNREDFNPNNPEEAELVVGKNRHGEAPILNCVFTPFLARYSEF
jgi:replicative DNA helicase